MMRGQPAACALDAPSRCLHCGQPLPAQSGRAGARGEFCCRGCQAVHRLLGAAGLERYYELRRGPGPPVSELDLSRRDRRWLEPLEASLAAGGHLELDVQGIHCAACVWLLEELFRRHPGSLRLIVNPALGSLALDFGPEFALRSFVEEVEALGYLLGPASGEARERASDGLLMRMGICLALAANGMLYAIAIYLGLSEGPLFELLHQLGYAAALLSVLVGGSVFIRSAWRGLRRGLVHLDLPIAIGIVLAFAGSSYAYFAGSAGPLYVDTLTVFIALMLVGRWLQERVLEGHRARLLRDDGIERLWARRVREGKPELVRVAELGAGDELLLGSGDLLAVEAELLDPEGAELSLDWIDGESEPRRFACGAAAPAGAFNAGDRVLRARALAPFAESGLRRLLRTTPAGAADEAMEGPWWQRISKAYVLGVLGAAGVALGGWWSATHDLLRAFEITTAVLVVTCPCAFGIAVPLAYEITLSRLRNGGLFVRRRGFLDRAARIRRVVFDKTGTLTTGRLGLVDASALEGLGAGARVALLNLASRSAHPKSVALLGALEARAWGGFEAALQVEERAGEGLEARIEGVRYRLGSPTFAAKGKVLPSGTDIVFSADEQLLLALQTREELRHDAAQELERLDEMGYETWVLSGDAEAKVRGVAASAGVPSERALGAHDPEAKAAWIRANAPEQTLLIGDGVNDGLAAQEALCSGTPAVDRPFMAARTDFYFLGAGLSSVTQALRASRLLAHTVRATLWFAVVYNALAVAIAWAGWMRPWLAATLMPASSLTTIALVSFRLRKSKLR